MKRLSVLLPLLFSGVANAATFNSLDALGQAQFRLLSENLTAATHYRGVTPAEPLGMLGLDVGVGLSSTEIDKSLFELASSGTFELSSILQPRLSLHKGVLPGIDFGVFYSGAPKTDIKLAGAELRYALLKGNVALPAIGVRVSYSALQGVEELEAQSRGIELTISKGLAIFTPYAGIGAVRSTTKPKGIAALTNETFNQTKTYVGLNINMGVNLTFEADKTGDYTSYSAKAGIRF